MVHPRYLLGSLEPSVYEAYKARNLVRALQSYKAMSEMMITNSLVKVKEAPPYSPELEVPVLMNSMARATLDVKTGSYKFSNKLTTKLDADLANVSTAAEMCGALIDAESSAIGVGVDQGESCSITEVTAPQL